MTQDEIIDMAIQAHVESKTWIDIYKDSTTTGDARQYLEAFAKLVAAKEREACAILAQKTVCDTHIPTGVRIYGTAAAKAIQARGEA